MVSKFFKIKCFQNCFSTYKSVFSKCFLQKDTCFSKQNVFKNTFTKLILPKNVFFLSLKRIKIYFLKKCFYHVKKNVCFKEFVSKIFFLFQKSEFFKKKKNLRKRFLRKQFLLPRWVFLKIKNKSFLRRKKCFLIGQECIDPFW